MMIKLVDLIPHDVLLQRMRLDRDSGLLYWTDSKLNSAKVRGKEAGNDHQHTTCHKAGKVYIRPRVSIYREIKLNGKSVRAHRLIWYYVYGTEPPEVIDHKDGDSLNNCPDNLRASDHKKNSGNRRAVLGGSSDYIGVSYNKRSKKFRAAIWIDGKDYSLGMFDTEIEAHLAYSKRAVIERGMDAETSCISALRREGILGPHLRLHEQEITKKALKRQQAIRADAHTHASI